MANIAGAIRNKSIFDIYVAWKSMPSVLYGAPQEALKRMGINSSIEHALLAIRNQQGFAEKYKVSQNTLSSWNRVIETKNLKGQIVGKWLHSKINNVYFALYLRCIKTGKASEVRLFLEITESYFPCEPRGGCDRHRSEQFQTTFDTPKESLKDIQLKIDEVIRRKSRILKHMRSLQNSNKIFTLPK